MCFLLRFIVVQAAFLLNMNKFTKTTNQIRSDRHIPEEGQFNRVDSPYMRCWCKGVRVWPHVLNLAKPNTNTAGLVNQASAFPSYSAPRQGVVVQMKPHPFGLHCTGVGTCENAIGIVIFLPLPLPLSVLPVTWKPAENWRRRVGIWAHERRNYSLDLSMFARWFSISSALLFYCNIF